MKKISAIGNALLIQQRNILCYDLQPMVGFLINKEPLGLYENLVGEIFNPKIQGLPENTQKNEVSLIYRNGEKVRFYIDPTGVDTLKEVLIKYFNTKRGQNEKL